MLCLTSCDSQQVHEPDLKVTAPQDRGLVLKLGVLDPRASGTCYCPLSSKKGHLAGRLSEVNGTGSVCVYTPVTFTDT